MTPTYDTHRIKSSDGDVGQKKAKATIQHFLLILTTHSTTKENENI